MRPVSANGSSAAIKALLSWPTDRADREHGDLVEDNCPTRCEERNAIATEARPRTPVTALLPIDGERARGAVVAILRREWLITEGDLVGDVRVTSVASDGVYLRRGSSPARERARLARFSRSGTSATGASHTGRPPNAPAPTRPPRLPLPPEPPAPLPQ
jgi:hypothetical protein